MQLDEGTWIDELDDALTGAQAEVIAAFRADTKRTFQLPSVDQLATLGALDPQIFRDLQLAPFFFGFFGTKLRPALEEIPHRRHETPSGLETRIRTGCPPSRSGTTGEDTAPGWRDQDQREVKPIGRTHCWSQCSVLGGHRAFPVRRPSQRP